MGLETATERRVMFGEAEIGGTPVRARDREGALRRLIMLGRIEDAQRVAGAAFRDPEFSASPEFAELAVTVAALTQDAALITSAYPELSRPVARTHHTRARLWQTLTPNLEQGLTLEQLDLLAQHTRFESRSQDATRLADAARRLGGRARLQMTFSTISEGLDERTTTAVRKAMGL